MSNQIFVSKSTKDSATSNSAQDARALSSNAVMSDKVSDNKSTKESTTSTLALDAQATSSNNPKNVFVNKYIATIPNEPYILGCPTDRPYQVPEAMVDNWRHNLHGLFDANEKYLQYQTFFWRDPMESLFSVHGADEIRARKKEEASKAAGGFKSGPGTPLAITTAKKKITLSDYKNKNRVGGQGTTPAAPSQPLETVAGVSGQPEVEKAAASLAPTVGGKAGEPAPEKAPEDVLKEATAKEAVGGDAIGEEALRKEVAGKNIIGEEEVGNNAGLVSKETTSQSGPAIQLANAASGAAAEETDEKRLLEPIPNKKRPFSTTSNEKASADEVSPSSEPQAKKSRLDRSEEGDRMLTGLAPTVKVHPASPVEERKDVVAEEMEAEIPESDSTSNAPAPPGQVGKWMLPSTKGKASPTSSPPSSLQATTPNYGLLGSWFPDTQTSDDGEEELPPRLEDVPAWAEAESDASGNRARGSSNSPASSESLKLSITYSQTSHSSLDLPSVDADANAKEPEPGKKQNVESAPLKKLPEKRVFDENKSRPTTTAGKTVHPRPGLSGKSVEAPKNARKTVKANPPPSGFFDHIMNQKKTASPRLAPTVKSSAADTPKLVVRLKYGKSLAKNVQRILQLKPTPRRDFVPGSNKLSESSTGATVPTQAKVPAESSSVAKKDDKKRAHDDVDDSVERLTKRKKLDAAETTPAPRTPNVPAVRTPATSSQSTSLHRQALTPTPQKDSKTGKLVAPTPKDKTPRSTFATPDIASTSEPGSSDPRTTRTTQAWNIEYKKQLQIAIDLKRKFQAFLAAHPTDKTSTEAKKQSVDGVESLLCFMQAFVSQGEHVRSNSIMLQQWQSILPFTKFIQHECQTFNPHLGAIATLLRSLCCSILASLCAGSSAEEVATLGPTESEVLKKVHGFLQDMQMQGLAAERALPRAVMEREFPKTAKVLGVLPYGVLSRGILAVRVGRVFLGEWCEREEVKWGGGLEEGLCAQL